MAVNVHLTTVHPRGDVRIWVKQCCSLAQRNHQELYLAVADSLGDEMVGAVRVLDVGRPPGGRAGRILIGSWRSFRLVRRLKADLVHFHDPELIPVCLLLSMLGHKVIYDVHEDTPRQVLAKQWLPGFLRRIVAVAVSISERIASRQLAGIVAATPAIAARFPPSKTVLVRNFPILEEFSNLQLIPQRERERAIAYIGVIAGIRGATQMINAVEQASDAGELRLKFAGNYSPPEVQIQLESLPGWRHVDSLGWLQREEIVRLLSEVRGGLVVLEPTRNYVDALPVKMFEYMAAGIPVIASDFPLWREIVEESGCGLLVDPADPASIAEALRWILEHHDEADAMGELGRRSVTFEYNWSNEAKKLLTFYDALGV